MSDVFDLQRKLGKEIARKQLEASVALIKTGHVKPAYCDYIAHRIKTDLSGHDPERLIAEVSHIKWDLHPTEGYFLSPKKTIFVTDRNGKRYRITVEEDKEPDTRPCDTERA